MKRVILGAVLALAFVLAFIWKGEREAPSKADEQPGLSEAQKVALRRFWTVYRQANAQQHQGMWPEAASAYREALAIDPRHEDALYELGNVLFEQAQYDAAVEAWRRLVEVNPISVRGYAQLGAVYSCGAAPFDLDAAEQALLQAQALNREETGLLLKLGEVALLKGERDRALDYFLAVCQSHTGSIEGYYLVGYLKWQEGDRTAAQAALQKAVKLSRGAAPRQVIGEGDTRSGGPMLAQGAVKKSFFAPHWHTLKEMKETISEVQMDATYGALHRDLKTVK